MAFQLNFSLLKLPYLCLKNVLHSFNVSDITIFSLTSKKCYRMAKTLKFTSLTGFSIVSKKEIVDICFMKRHTSDSTDVSGKWRFDFEETTMGKPFTIYDGGEEIKTTWLNSESFPFLNNNPVQSVKNSLQYLFVFFGLALTRISIWTDGAEKSIANLIKLGIKECNYLKIDSSDALTNEDDFNVFLENTCYNFGIFDIQASPNFVFNAEICSPLRTYFKNRSGGWMTRDVLFGLQTEEIIALNCDSTKITGMHFMEFVNRWFYWDDFDIEFKLLSMSWRDGYGHIDEEYWKWFRPQR